MHKSAAAVFLDSPSPVKFAIGKGHKNWLPKQCVLQPSDKPICMQPTLSAVCLFFFLDFGQYSPSKPIDNKKRVARSDIKEASNFKLSTLVSCRNSRQNCQLPEKITKLYRILELIQSTITNVNKTHSKPKRYFIQPKTQFELITSINWQFIYVTVN